MITLNQNAPAAVASADDGDGGHWYTIDAKGQWQPLYEPGKTFTLREARAIVEAGGVAVPSVTTIFKVMAKGQVDRWQRKQVAVACWNQHVAGTPDTMDEFIDRALATASGASQGAMQLGTDIHAAVEDAIAGREYAGEMDVYVQAVLAERARLGITSSRVEECVGSLKWGYAGRCDENTDDMVVNDIKSRKATGKKTLKVPFYPTDPAQLASYGAAKFGNEFFRRGRGNIFGVATNAPGVCTVHSWTGPELVKPFAAFLALNETWRYLNNFDPRKA